MSATMLLAALVSLTAGPPAQDPPMTLQAAWTLDGFASPESVLPSPDGGYFVSNVGGEGDARDGDGYISRVSRDGHLLERTWAVGLNAPKGMARVDDRLFVADIDRVVVLDARSGRLLETHAIDGAEFLNDAAALPDGSILVSDSAGRRIYRLTEGQVEVWLEDPRLQGVNGILVAAPQVVLATMQGVLLGVQPETRAMSLIAVGLGAADGVAHAPQGGYVVSEWRGRLFHVSERGRVSILLDTREQTIYQNDLTVDDGVLLVPNWMPGRLTAYRLPDGPPDPPLAARR